MVIQENIHQAKTHLSKLIEKAIAGNEVIIAKNGKPIVKLVLVKDSIKKRTPGSAEGEIKEYDDILNPMPDDFMLFFQ